MNAPQKYILIEKNTSSPLRMVMDIISKRTVKMEQPGGAIWSVRTFFGLKTNTYRKSRILRKYNKAFEEFVFKGYDQQQPGLSRPGSFKNLKMLCKN